MSEHAGTAHADAHAAPATADLRFEKSEYHYFTDEDQNAGRAIGTLLAFTFCFLLAFMSSVSWWASAHTAIGIDPQTGVIPAANDAHDHH